MNGNDETQSRHNVVWTAINDELEGGGRIDTVPLTCVGHDAQVRLASQSCKQDDCRWLIGRRFFSQCFCHWRVARIFFRRCFDRWLTVEEIGFSRQLRSFAFPLLQSVVAFTDCEECRSGESGSIRFNFIARHGFGLCDSDSRR